MIQVEYCGIFAIRIVVIAAVMLSSTVHSQTLCQSGEIDYFSCETSSSGRLISVCGNIDLGEIDEKSWVQYRFGKTGAIELAYPTELAGSPKMFEGNNFNKYTVSDLRFVNDGKTYSVRLEGVYSGDEAQERLVASGGVTIGHGYAKERIEEVECLSIDEKIYLEPFANLNARLRSYSGETDFFFDYAKGKQ
jgi:hypothetical protein